jgi:hypothetical protein
VPASDQLLAWTYVGARIGCEPKHVRSAMPRYFFHVKHDGATMHDREGIVLDDLEAARNEARRLARQSMSERLNAHPHPLDGRMFVVTDEEGHTVLTYPFIDAIGD